MLTRDDLKECELLRKDGIVFTVTESEALPDGDQQPGSLLWRLRCQRPSQGAERKDLVLCCSCTKDDSQWHDNVDAAKLAGKDDGSDAWDRVVAVEVAVDPVDFASRIEEKGTTKSVRFGGSQRAAAPPTTTKPIKLFTFAPEPRAYHTVRAADLGDIELPANCIELKE
jgi:hypothetical protein